MKQLPMTFPLIETYQGVSFVFAAMTSNRRVMNCMYNKYINVYSSSTDDIWEVKLIYENVLWDEYATEGIVDVDFFSTNNLKRDQFSGFLEERINQNCYICLYHLDEYFLSYSPSYHTNHFSHDLYVYGYTDTTFQVMAYRNMKLELFEVLKEEIVDALFEQEKDEDKEFASMRIMNNISVDIDYDRIKAELKKYYRGNCDYSDDLSHGVAVYSNIINSLKKLVKQEGNPPLDIRVFRMLWEHKLLMTKRIKMLSEKYEISESIPLFDEVEKLTSNLFLRSLKYTLLPSKDKLLKMSNLVEEIYNKDMQCGDILFKLWNE